MPKIFYKCDPSPKNLPSKYQKKKEFLYDSMMKQQKKGRYQNSHGFTCNICRRSIKDLKSHFCNVHPSVDVESKEFDRQKCLSSINNRLQTCIEVYERKLCSCCIAKRNKTTKTAAKTYARQVTTLIHSLEDLHHPEIVHQQLQKLQKREGGDSTKYAYMATFLNFLYFLQRDFPDIKTETMIKHATDYMQRQNQKKKNVPDFF